MKLYIKKKRTVKEVTKDSLDWMYGFIFFKYIYLSIKEIVSIKEAIPFSLEVEFQKPHPLQAVD